MDLALVIVLQHRWPKMYLRDQVACIRVSRGIAAVCARLFGPVRNWNGEREDLSKVKHATPRDILLLLGRLAPERCEFFVRCAMNVREFAWVVYDSIGECDKFRTYGEAVDECEGTCDCGHCEYRVAEYLGYTRAWSQAEIESEIPGKCELVGQIESDDIGITFRYVPLE